MPKSDWSRRDFFTLAAASSFTFANRQSLFGLDNPAQKAGKKAKNIIFCVSDGMSISVPSMLNEYLRLTTGNSSYWSELMNQDDAVNGLQLTRSLTGPVTDSSAASSAWGSGVHIWNGAVNWLPGGTNGIELRSLFQILKAEAKMKLGLVSTASITHATPAGFAICHNNRDEEWIIAEKYLELAPDVLFGGGDKFFAAEKRKDKRDLYESFRKAGYAIAKNLDELTKLPSNKRLLGVFSSGHVPYEVDRLHDSKLQSTIPTLADMARQAIKNLENTNGFILQIEGARIDHGGHTNDFAAQLFDQMAFEEAVKVAVEFARNDGETLVVVTSDHANGNPGLAGAGDEYFDSTAGLLCAQKMTCSFGPLLTQIKADQTLDRVIGTVKDNYEIELTKEESQFVLDGLKKEGMVSKLEVFGEDFSNLALVLSNHSHVNYMTHAHTSDNVMVTALGPGSERFQGLTRNVSYFDHFLAMRDLEYKNPTLGFEEARKHYIKSPVTEHWL